MFPNPPGLLRLEPYSEALRDRIWWGRLENNPHGNKPPIVLQNRYGAASRPSCLESKNLGLGGPKFGLTANQPETLVVAG
jgi:hypothetical protein